MADDQQDCREARANALAAVLGPGDGMVRHSLVPFAFGPECGGRADVVYFRQHLAGVVAVTDELIGLDEQPASTLGNYELMICQRDEPAWGTWIISQLAHTTMQARLEPGQTMDIGSGVPAGSTIAAFLFTEYARFAVLGRPAGLLLCVGITADELAACRAGHRAEVEAALKSSGVYPFTDLYRPSVLNGRFPIREDEPNR